MTGFRDGATNENPEAVSLMDLIFEDFRTNGATPGFIALLVHRLGNARMDVSPKAFRAPLSLAYRVAFQSVIAAFGIDMPYNTKVGRRLKIEHHGCLMMGAREIGNDVTIRGNITFGVRERGTVDLPVIGSNIEFGPGAAVLGGVVVSDDCVIGANTVVGGYVKKGAHLLGVPAMKVLQLRSDRVTVRP